MPSDRDVDFHNRERSGRGRLRSIRLHKRTRRRCRASALRQMVRGTTRNLLRLNGVDRRQAGTLLHIKATLRTQPQVGLTGGGVAKGRRKSEPQGPLADVGRLQPHRQLNPPGGDPTTAR